jgi:opacity protein-like surface antigen
MASAFCAALLLAGSAAQAQTSAPYDWSGLYIGVHAGIGVNSGSWNNNQDPNRFLDPALVNSQANDVGLFGGAHIGINWQINHFVFGIEGSADVTSMNSNSSPVLFASLKTSQNYLASLVAHGGYAFDRTLIYGSGGLALTDYHFSDSDSSPCAATSLFSILISNHSVGRSALGRNIRSPIIGLLVLTGTSTTSAATMWRAAY